LKFLYFFIIVIFSSCILDADKAIESDSDIPSQVTDQSNSASKSDKSDDEISSGDRGYWQKPDLIIDKLGNLKGKTIADIGAGRGYFSFEIANRNVEKVIAIDIDVDKINFLNFLREGKIERYKEFENKFEVRLATETDPKLNENEVDIILIVNTIVFINDRVEYLQNLRKTLKPGGKLVVVDFKTKKIPDFVNAPEYDNREYLHVIEEQIEASGFAQFESDDTSLDFQYIIVATK